MGPVSPAGGLPVRRGEYPGRGDVVGGHAPVGVGHGPGAVEAQHVRQYRARRIRPCRFADVPQDAGGDRERGVRGPVRLDPAADASPPPSCTMPSTGTKPSPPRPCTRTTIGNSLKPRRPRYGQQPPSRRACPRTGRHSRGRRRSGREGAVRASATASRCGRDRRPLPRNSPRLRVSERSARQSAHRGRHPPGRCLPQRRSHDWAVRAGRWTVLHWINGP